MHLYTPPGLLYPIKVTRLLREPGSEIVENAPLFDYEYKSKVTEGVWTEKEGNVDRDGSFRTSRPRPARSSTRRRSTS